MSPQFFILMGVAGSGKSSVGQAVAGQLGWTLIESDDFHSAVNKQKMTQGVALTDEDRSGWLQALVDQLHAQLALGKSAVLLCSALKRRYRDVFRTAFPGARFVYLQIPETTALVRVDARAGAHLFPPSLVPSQFSALESPEGEPGVLTVDAARPLALVCEDIVGWLAREAGQGAAGLRANDAPAARTEAQI